MNLALPSRSSISQLIVMASGILCGVIGLLVHPVLSVGILINGILFLLLVRYPMFCFKFLIIDAFVFTSLIPHKIGFLLSWLLYPAFLTGTALLIYKERIPLTHLKSKMGTALFLLAGWTLIAGLFAVNQVTSAKEVFRYSLSFSLFFIYLHVLNEERVSAMLRWWAYGIFSASFLVIYSSFVLLTNESFKFPGDFKGQVAHLSWGISCFLIIYATLLSYSSKRIRIHHILFFTLMSFSLYLTNSRTAYISTFLGLIGLAWSRFSAMAKRILIIGVGASLLLGFIGLGFVYDSSFDGVVRNLSGRNFLWSAAIKAASEDPLTGIGPGNWQQWLIKNYVSADFIMDDREGNTFALTPELQPGEAHNLYLTKAAEMGFVAIPLIFIFLWVWFQNARKNLKIISDSSVYGLTLGCFLALLSMTFYGMFENAPIIGRGRGPEAFLLWLLAAIPLSAHQWDGKKILPHLLPGFLFDPKEAR